MDKFSVWADMISSTRVGDTGKKTVTVKLTRHKKTHVSVCLTGKADGTKLSPFMVFKGAKQESAALDKEIKTCCIPSSQING